MFNRTSLCLFGGLFLSTAVVSEAAFELVSNYEDGLGAAVVSQGTSGVGAAAIVADPIDTSSSNQVLSFHAGTSFGNSLQIVTPIPEIAEGDVGTLFFRFAVDSSQAPLVASFAVTPLAAPTTHGDTIASMNPNQAGDIVVRNGGGFTTVVSPRENLTWYKAWYLLDSDTDTYDVYLQGGSMTEPTLVADDFAFRADTTETGLESLWFWTNSGPNGDQDGIIYVDDIYVDAGTIDLLDPLAPTGPFALVANYENGMGAAVVSQGENGVGSADIVADPAPMNTVTNQVLSFHAGTSFGNSLQIVTPIPEIAEGDSGTVFLRFAVDSSEAPLVASLAVTPVAAPTTHGDTVASMNPNQAGDILVRNGGGFDTVVSPRENLTWYKAWYLLNSATDTYDVYLQGGAMAAPTLVADDFAFRADTTETGLETLWFWTNSGPNGDQDGTIYVDDVYTATGLSLADPLVGSQEPASHLGILKTSATVTVDGVKDSAYTARGEAIGYFGGLQAPSNADDLSAMVYGTWNDSGIYFYVDVTDDVFNSDNDLATGYQDDSIQFYFDPENSYEEDYDGHNDVVLMIHPLASGTEAEISIDLTSTFGGGLNGGGTADFSAAEVAIVQTATGWAVEFFAPWAGLQIEAPVDDWNMGLSIQINDDDGIDLSDPADGTDDRESFVVYARDMEGNLNRDPMSFGDLTLWTSPVALARKTSAAITVDGTKDDAYGPPVQAFDGRWHGAGAHPMDTDADFRLLYDDENLYFLVEVTDASIIAGESTEYYLDDAIEIYLDGNNSKGGAHDGVDDVKLAFQPTDLSGGLEMITTDGYPPPPTGTDFSGLEAAQTVTATGWNLEVKMPLSIIKMSATPGHAFGLDVHILDDDDGGARDGVLAWSGAGGNNRTDTYGTAHLFGRLTGTAASTDSAVTIDGDVDEAYMSSGWQRFRGSAAPFWNDLGGYWSAVYDDTYVYLVVDVFDDSIVVDSGEQVYLDDGLEIFFDPLNNGQSIAGSMYVGDNIKISAIPQLESTEVTLRYTLAQGQYPGAPAGADFTGIDAAWAETTLGYRIELQIPFTALQISAPVAGMDLGFEIVVKDDDDGEGGDGNLVWSSFGSTNQSSSEFGVLYLGGDALFATIIDADLVSGITYDSWLGSFMEDPSFGRWVWHEGFDWLYTGYVAPGAAGFWLFSHTLNAWVYTREGLFPYVYVDGTGWAYYAHFGDGVGFLYVLSSSQWMEIE